MTDPRQSEVWHKKQEVADRTLNERRYCKLCDYYYSEMYTCPICYGEQRAVERIVKLLEEPMSMNRWWMQIDRNLGIYGNVANYVMALIKGESK